MYKSIYHGTDQDLLKVQTKFCSFYGMSILHPFSLMNAGITATINKLGSMKICQNI